MWNKVAFCDFLDGMKPNYMLSGLVILFRGDASSRWIFMLDMPNEGNDTRTILTHRNEGFMRSVFDLEGSMFCAERGKFFPAGNRRFSAQKTELQPTVLDFGLV